MPQWLRYLQFGQRPPSLWLLRPLSLLTALVLATQAQKLEPVWLQHSVSGVLALLLLWCFIWLVWHLRVRLKQHKHRNQPPK
ncbi:hypothetical protein [Marinomonas ostreistagni]|uniref:hypothetical protein n=1 Tax=Marinomonas ostreistagni TaxID=359209 RepID=UPI0019508506|nr:hypothetical protein [Marinomonas ostreistagni]MBM6550222.1 hypothetical protein [Marinomonas ostreistagni]